MAYMCLPGKSGRQGSLYWYAFVYLERTWTLKGADKETDVKKHIFFFFLSTSFIILFFFLNLFKEVIAKHILYTLLFIYVY